MPSFRPPKWRNVDAELPCQLRRPQFIPCPCDARIWRRSCLEPWSRPLTTYERHVLSPSFRCGVKAFMLMTSRTAAALLSRVSQANAPVCAGWNTEGIKRKESLHKNSEQVFCRNSEANLGPALCSPSLCRIRCRLIRRRGYRTAQIESGLQNEMLGRLRIALNAIDENLSRIAS